MMWNYGRRLSIGTVDVDAREIARTSDIDPSGARSGTSGLHWFNGRLERLFAGVQGLAFASSTFQDSSMRSGSMNRHWFSQQWRSASSQRYFGHRWSQFHACAFSVEYGSTCLTAININHWRGFVADASGMSLRSPPSKRCSPCQGEQRLTILEGERATTCRDQVQFRSTLLSVFDRLNTFKLRGLAESGSDLGVH